MFATAISMDVVMGLLRSLDRLIRTSSEVASAILVLFDIDIPCVALVPGCCE